MTPETLSALGSLSGPALLVAAILTGARGIWVWGWAHRAEIAAKDAVIAHKDKEIIYYRDMAFRLANIADKTAGSREQQIEDEPWIPSKG